MRGRRDGAPGERLSGRIRRLSRLPGLRLDTVNVLTVYLVLLVGIPATLVVGPLGAAGAPSNLFGILCFVWWVLARVDRRFGLRVARQPLHLFVAFFAASLLLSYVVGTMRVLEVAELSSSDRFMLRVVSLLGVLLLSADGLADRTQVDAVLRRVSVAGGVLAILGILQFVFGVEVNTYIKIPGLTEHTAAQLIQERSAFRRVSGTAAHPIEFGVVLSTLFPIALHYAMTAVRARNVHRTAAIAIGAAIPMSISRSAMLGLVCTFLVLLVGWDWRRRANALLVAPFALAIMRMAVPGLLGTIKSLFTGLSNDPSYLGRTNDYDYVREYIATRPWLGRGPGTFIPELYTTLDNQYLGQIVETGYVGLVALVLLIAAGVALGWRVRKRATNAEDRSLGTSLAAAAVVPMVTFITFDGLGFSLSSGFAFLVIGCAGATRRTARLQSRPRVLDVWYGTAVQVTPGAAEKEQPVLSHDVGSGTDDRRRAFSR